MWRQQQKMIDFEFLIGFGLADEIPEDCLPRTGSEKVGWSVAALISAAARAVFYGCQLRETECVLEEIASVIPELGFAEREEFSTLITATEKMRFVLDLGAKSASNVRTEASLTPEGLWSGFFKYNKYKNMRKQFHEEVLISYENHG